MQYHATVLDRIFLQSENADECAVVIWCLGTGSALFYAPKELRNARGVVLAAVTQDGTAIKHASARLRQDKTVALAAVVENGLALGFCSAVVQDDFGIVMAAVTQNGLALEHASVQMQSDLAIVKAAMDQNADAVRPNCRFLSVFMAVNQAFFVFAVVLCGEEDSSPTTWPWILEVGWSIKQNSFGTRW
eukprot:SAG31_NODE_2432_length_5706_cov_41.121634_5_plen_189_part_00